VAGLLVFVPAGFTILALLWTVEQLDNLVLPRIFRLVGMEAKQPPIVGALVTLAVILALGATTRSVIGRTFVHFWERVVERIPVARSLYSVIKQFMEAVLGQSEKNFKRVVLVEYPRQGLWAYGFVTGRSALLVEGMPADLLKVFVPSTPNPTTGYYVLVPEADVIDTRLSVEQAFRLIVSAGISGEELRPPARPLALERPKAL
jgi:uncharacterized membrane protein